MRKFLIIVIIILVALVAAGAVYYFFFQEEASLGEEPAQTQRRGFFPFGFFGNGGSSEQQEQSGAGDEEATSTQSQLPEEGSRPTLEQLTDTPVAATIFTTDNNDKVVIRYIEQTTGHVFDINPKTRERARVTNTTIPRIQNAVWASPNTVLLQYLQENTDTIETFFATVSRSTTTQEGSLVGSFLPRDILSVAVNQDSGELFYLLENGGGSTGFITSFDDSEELVFSSPLLEWRPVWNNGGLVLTTKPSGSAFGYTFLLDRRSGQISKLFGGLLGLTVLPSPDNNLLLYSTAQNGLSLFVTTTDTFSAQNLPLATLPEKCVWSELSPQTIYCGVPPTIPDEVLPDSWYMGATSFSDSLWRINTQTNEVESLQASIPLGFNIENEFDVTNPQLSADEEYLSFINKQDGTLWLLHLPGNSTQATSTPTEEE